MSRRVSWFCCDAGLPTDPRVFSLSDNDCRWTYLCLLALEKAGELEGQNVALFFRHCGVDKGKFLAVLSELQEAELIDGDCRPIGFDEWQKAALNAERQRRHRGNSNATVTDMSRNRNATVTQRNAAVTTDTDTDTDTDKNHDMSSSPRAANLDGVVEDQVDQVIEHFKTITGKKRVSAKANSNRKHIRARLKDGTSPADLMAIADLKTAQVKSGDFKDQYLRIETLYNETKCQSYLAELDKIRAGPHMTPRTKQAADALKEFYERNGTDAASCGNLGPLGSSDGRELGRGETGGLPSPAVGSAGGVPGQGDPDAGEN